MRNVLRIGLALLTGGFMLADGLHARVYGTYVGSALGPWALVLRAVHLDPRPYYSNGIFIVYGLMWLGAIAFYLAARRIALLVMAIATLWYIPFGTLASLIVAVSYARKPR